ncbi:hypothetical protein [Klebsiella oxytoca]|uniref:hypothetical protein n=1 Tax=Klebsiella oxytoca TaxID=571 RepID=UPI000D52A2D6|nr:hypothetical protein [Klebsiella oxytoca]AWF35689.1 hypothetical protein CSC17_3637 [Klebsiella oxytoca]QTV83998.1 hypothetical protein KAT64_02530 [Klebsiella oxytoca]HDX8950483.1 hypothetical protein [Klebsiella oxytoca]
MKIQRLATLLLLALPCFSYAEECQLTLSQQVLDYHQIRRDNIISSQQSWNKMPEKEINVSVYCPEKQQMATLLQGASGQKGRFQFGQNGGVAIKVSNLTLDGKSYNVGKTSDQVNFTPENDNGASLYIRNNEAVIAVEKGKIPSGQQMNFTVTIFPVLNDSAFNHIADQTALESDLIWQLLTR